MQRHTGARRIAVFGLPIVVLAAIAWGVAVFLERPSPTLPRDADLCPATGAIAGRTAMLLDLRKPLSERGRALLGEALRQVASELAANAELRVFALSGTDAAPRQRIDRLCRPYGESALARDGAVAPQADLCDGLPADLPERDAALRFCARLDSLAGRIDGMAQLPPSPVPNAFLVEAIEETSLEFGDAPGRKSLVVFSDMVQHAQWYSQAEGAATFGFADFAQLRARQSARIGPRPPALQDVDVTIFYLPRIGMTESPQERRGHKRFWQEYVADAFRTAPVINELPAMPRYEVASFSGQATNGGLAAAQRLQQEREEAERLLEQVVRERAALEEAQRTAAARTPAPVAAQAGLPLQRAAEQEPSAGEREGLAPSHEEPSAGEREGLAPSHEEPEGAELPSAPALADTSAAEDPASDPTAVALAADAPATGSEQDASPSSEGIEESEANDESPSALAVESSSDTAPPSAPVATSPPAPPLPSPEEPPPLQEDLASLDAAPSNAPCPLQLKPRFQGVVPEFPRLPSRTAARLAAATIAVRYVVDEQGATVDSAVTIVESASTANPPAFLSQFADSARELVERWEFDFLPTADLSCAKQQELTTAFKFGDA